MNIQYVFFIIVGSASIVSGYSSFFRNIFYTRPSGTTKITDFPKLNYQELTDQNKYDLQWYVIGTKADFSKNVPKKTTIWNKNYVVWRNNENQYVGLDDVCPHKGASLAGGKVCNNHVVCPYHGYEFDENGKLDKVPGISFHPSPVYDVSKYQVIEKNGWVYLNTYSDIAKIDNSTGLPYSENIFVEPEVARNDSAVFLDMDFNCYSRIVSENSLDVMHIGFVHTFGNSKNPAPVEVHPPKEVGPNHFKTSYLYEAGDKSFARKIFGAKDLRIENEFILPHTTIARVIFGPFISTVITFALPINENKSKLFVKTYRNFWPNQLGDMVTENWMFNTMLQDKLVIENIDSRFMDGKFNMRFDKLQNTYKTFYKRFIHDFTRDT
jgi:phenylpropionate dioxygenase-like ring-hydroxylating dioxygenase large terminal subunit